MSRYGYTTESGVEIPAMIDMIDGGGAGRSGDRFEGGGILSLLANVLARPYGSVQRRPGYGAPGTSGAGGGTSADGEPLPEPPTELMEPRADEPTPPVGGVDDSYGGGRVLQWNDLVRIRELAPPAIQALFTNDMLGEELTDPQLVMILNTLEDTASIGRQDAPLPRRPTTPAPTTSTSGTRPDVRFGASREMTEEDVQFLAGLEDSHPEIFDMFTGAGVGSPITASESLLLRNLSRDPRTGRSNFPGTPYSYSESPGSRYAP